MFHLNIPIINTRSPFRDIGSLKRSSAIRLFRVHRFKGLQLASNIEIGLCFATGQFNYCEPWETSHGHKSIISNAIPF